MDTDAIRQIPIEDFLSRLGHEPVKRSGNELWYSAPYRSERTPSFHVNVEKQVWYDFGLGKGGDIFTLAGEFMHSTDFLTQARFIAEAAGTPLAGMERKPPRPKPPGPVFEKVEVFPLLRSALTDYLAERGIPYEVASRHCCRLDYGVHGKRYYAVGFPNMAGGYEIRNRFFKGCIPPKQVSLVRQKETPAEVCCVFEGFMDFLSALTLGLGGAGDHLVLNSVTNVKRATEYLDSYRGIECFLDRDEAGRKALETLRAYYGRGGKDRPPPY
ncbi:toprim-like family protein [Bacteroides fragilis str. S24L15]|nr:toprim-like family protein [Bacteroides fragilis str. S24L15]